MDSHFDHIKLATNSTDALAGHLWSTAHTTGRWLYGCYHRLKFLTVASARNFDSNKSFLGFTDLLSQIVKNWNYKMRKNIQICVKSITVLNTNTIGLPYQYYIDSINIWLGCSEWLYAYLKWRSRNKHFNMAPCMPINWHVSLIITEIQFR